MIRTGKYKLHNLVTGKTYQRKAGEAGVYVYCDDQRISDNDTTNAVWDYLLSLVHTELTEVKDVTV